MNPKTRKDRRWGQVVVLAPVMLFVLSAILALTADVGQIFVWRARLQNAADAAALAATHVLVTEQLDGAEEASARSAALTEATLIREANALEAGVNVEFGQMDEGGSFAAADTATTATAVRVTAFRTKDAPGGRLSLFFAPLLGLNSCDVAGAGTCEVTADIAGILAGMAPFAVPENGLVPPGSPMIFYPADGEDYDGLGDLTVAPGCWGLLNLDGGALGTDELVDWIENGYDDAIEIDPEVGYLWIDGTSGFRSALQSVMRSKIDGSMIVAIYDEVVGVGSGADFRCTGFVKVIIKEVALTGTNPHITCVVAEVGMLHDLIGGLGTPSLNILKIQLVN